MLHYVQDCLIVREGEFDNEFVELELAFGLVEELKWV
jgi:hypothetical protein